MRSFDKSLPEKVAALSTLQRIGTGLTNIGKMFVGEKWNKKLQELQTRAAAGDESATHLLSLMGLASITAGTAGGLGAARLFGAKRKGLALGTAAGSLLGTLPLAAAREAPPAVTLPGFDMDKRSKAVRMRTGGIAMLKSAMGGNLLKLDTKGISLPALQALYSRDIAGALQHPGIVALVAGRKERVRRLKEELNQPGMHLKQEEPQAGAEEMGMPQSSLPAAPGSPMPPSNHMGLFGGGGMPGMAAGGMPGMPPKISTRVETYFSKSAKQLEKPKKGTGVGRRVEAYKYGFFTKFAEVGILPSELCALMEKRAGTLPFLAGQTAVGAAGRASGEAGGAAKTIASVTAKLVRLGLTAPAVLAMLTGTGAGAGYRMLTAPGYDDPESLRQVERVSLYKRLGREAQLRARRLQQKRLASTSKQEPTVDVPAMEEAA